MSSPYACQTRIHCRACLRAAARECPEGLRDPSAVPPRPARQRRARTRLRDKATGRVVAYLLGPVPT